MTLPIKNLFDPARDIYRRIEKVVTFGSREEADLKREISEYVVTDNLKYSFERLLDAFYDGMESESHEVGIWVSGFYGSGKSSFSKYLGLALQQQQTVEQLPFYQRLANRIGDNRLEQQLKTLVKKYDPQVFLIDLATQQISGYNLAPVGTIIYHQVMKWAGYATEAKIAYLERRLEMDQRLDEFRAEVQQKHHEQWDELKFKDKLSAKAIAQELAPQFYPNLYKNARAFNIVKVEDVEDEQERMAHMLELIEQKSGKPNVLFVIDEVGQYVAAKEELILQLQGTMENLKNLGRGKAWLLATAQQTLTEDNPNARYNSAKLNKLADRFPLKIDIEASDIEEITTQRLLGKSPEGASQLKSLYAQYGEQLRLHTRLQQVERSIYRKADLTEQSFTNLYPFLPHHFSALITLLTILSKRTGGIGLRSAIRVIQDVLTETSRGVRLAEKPLGTLATAYHIYQVLKPDIRKSYQHVVEAVDRVEQRFADDPLAIKVAQAVATLQVLDDFPLTVENLTVMMHPSLEAESQLKAVKEKVQLLKDTRGLTLKEIDGELRFMTDAIIRIEEEKSKIFVSRADIRRVVETQIEDLFSPTPSIRLANTKTVKTGIQLIWEDRPSRLIEPNEEIQLEIHLPMGERHDTALVHLQSDSTQAVHQNRMYLIGSLDAQVDALLEEIVRCEGIYGTRSRYSDKEISDYLNSQQQEAEQLKQQVRYTLTQSLLRGEFVFRGQTQPAESLGQNLREASNAWLKQIAEKVYHRYEQAPQSLESSAAQKLQRFDELRSVPPTLNPFGLIQGDGSIDVHAPALQSLKDYLQREGQIDGRKLLDQFQKAPYGWNRDTIRYLVTLMFLASEVKLRIAGEYVKVKGATSLEKLSSTAAFNGIGLALHSDDQPTQQQKLTAAKNLAELTGQTVAPLPQKISEVTMKHFPEFQRRYAELRLRLQTLELPGVDRAEAIQTRISEVLKGDASDATFLLGKSDADLFLDLKWARQVQDAFEQGIEQPIQQLRELRSAVEALPEEAIITALKGQLAPRFAKVDQLLETDTFFDHRSVFKEDLSEINLAIAQSCEAFRESENQLLQQRIEEIKHSVDWSYLDEEQKSEFSTRLDSLQIGEAEGVAGLQEIFRQAFSLGRICDTIRQEVKTTAEAIQAPPQVQEGEQSEEESPSIPNGPRLRRVSMRRFAYRINKPEDLEPLIQELQSLQADWQDDQIIELDW